MVDYKQMYHLLFNKITDIIEDLQEIQQQTEEIYMNQENQIIKLFISENKKRDQ